MNKTESLPETTSQVPIYQFTSDQSTILALESAHTSGVYPKRPLAIVRGRGAHVWDAEGREYIDCVGGQGAANLGHAHPDIVAAISRQAATLISCPEIFYNDQRARLLARLAEVAPAGMNRAFLCNSGTEAIEAALKFTRLSTGRREIVAAVRGFHGRTMGALSATWNKEYRAPFEPLVLGFGHVPYNDLAALDKVVTDQTAAVLLEVVQGEGGVYPATAEFLLGAQALCRERGALLILDEVQTGYGRTGKLFACQHTGVEPDLMAVAKSMAGGLPMGACLIGPRVANLAPMTHGSTFGGNPLACAAALATLDVLTPPSPPSPETAVPFQEKGGVGGGVKSLPDRAARLGASFMERLRRINSPLIREVRGLGLLVGVDLRVKVTPILQKLQTLGVLALPAGSTVLRFLPPLVIEEEDLERVVKAVEQVLQESGVREQGTGVRRQFLTPDA
jgi:acetylornithine/LysW-gamma-L-lysine aminotransferase